MKRAGLLVLLSFALTGCGLLDAVVPDSGPLLRTDSSSYVLRLLQTEGGPGLSAAQAIIGFTFANRTGHDVQAEGCAHPDPPLLERKTGDGWAVAWGGSYLLCYSAPVRIAEGESYTGTLNLVVSVSGGPYPDPGWLSPGRYRLRWDMLGPATDAQRRSNEFTIAPGWRLEN